MTRTAVAGATLRRRISLSARIAALPLAAAFALAACSSGGSTLPPIPPSTPAPSAAPESSEPAPSTEPPKANPDGCPPSQPPELPAGETRTVTIETELGAIVVKVDGSLSPIAAGNFVALSECGWYDGVIFHRLVPDFVIQGGDGQNGREPNVDPSLAGTGGPGYTIQDEPVTAEYGRGTVAMARTSAPNSVGSQFFIVLDDQAREALAYYNTYQIIGTVVEGMDVVDQIAAMPNSGQPSNAALDPVAMQTVTVTNP
jgi:cyclophilin family peptidyl-prolyl cis-trans isomerase